MNPLLGKLICFLYRGHADRRLRKGEPVPEWSDVTHGKGVRICARCGRLRAVKARRKA